jgi:hypothetical protein
MAKPKIFLLIILSFPLISFAEGRLGVEAYFLGANGSNINYRHFLDNERYIKLGTGSESLDVDGWDGDISYDYDEIGFGYYALEFFYRIPKNIVATGSYADDDIGGYPGIKLDFEQRSNSWNFSWYGAWSDLHDAIGLTAGIQISYTLGYGDSNYLASRNRAITAGAEAFNEGLNSINQNNYNNSYNYSQPYNTQPQNNNLYTPSYNTKPYYQPPTRQNTYEGRSGTVYQYDLSNPIDRNSYSIDLDAQRRDQLNTDPGQIFDFNSGQQGGGIYND